MTPMEMPVDEPMEGMEVEEEGEMAEEPEEPIEEEVEEEEPEEVDESEDIKESFTKQLDGLREEMKVAREKDMSEIRAMIKDFLDDK